MLLGSDVFAAYEESTCSIINQRREIRFRLLVCRYDAPPIMGRSWRQADEIP